MMTVRGGRVKLMIGARLEVAMLRPTSLVFLVILVGLAAPVRAQDGGEAKAAVHAAIAACDKGAAVPLDPDATSAPVQLWEIAHPFNRERMEKLLDVCLTAIWVAPDLKRLELQYLRVALLLGKVPSWLLAPHIQKLASAGSAEANYLLYRLVIGVKFKPQLTPEEAIAGLLEAAKAGHQEALQVLVREYLDKGPLLARDPRKAADAAARLMNMPPQGIVPGASEDAARREGRAKLRSILAEDDGFTKDK
ncbi:MAG: hypothetical protein GEV13_08600 [Rhodospirillales bacterium]|nr:hypothetical protein [Rhodospirillales bacterium]